jgi:hypothetical protein
MTDTPPRSLRPLILPGVLALAIAFGLFACGKKEETPPAQPRTAEQQRKIDSTVGASGLPGAHGVQGALRVQDSAAARQKQLDSIMKAP